MFATFFSRPQWRMLWKYLSKLFLVQENFEHNTWCHWEWHITVVAHSVLSNLLGNCLPLHHPRNWNHRKGTGRTEKCITPRFGSCSPDNESHHQGKPSSVTTLAPLRLLLVQWSDSNERYRWLKMTLLFHCKCFCPTSLPSHSFKSNFVKSMFCKCTFCFFERWQCSLVAVLSNIIRITCCNNFYRTCWCYCH